MLARSVIVAALAVVPAFAQSTPRASATPSPMSQLKKVWERERDYIMDAAVEVPESTYAFRPTPEVRTFGELIAHLAGSQDAYCAEALGEKPPAEDAVEKATTAKAALIEAFRKSNDHCARAYAQSDADAAKPVNASDGDSPRLSILIANATHDSEHYGNIVTYMRMNHMVPPSSKPRK
jgi:uncharacterized damage-inducible protein DinB